MSYQGGCEDVSLDLWTFGVAERWPVGLQTSGYIGT